MKFAIVLAAVFTWSTVAQLALADMVGPGSCGGGPSATQEMCRQMCPYLVVEGDCSNADAGAKRCGIDSETACLPIPDNCTIETAEGGALPTHTDAGAPLLYCLEPRRCGGAVERQGCSVGTDDSRTGGPSSLPAVMVIGGILFLAVDRRRRKRHEH